MADFGTAFLVADLFSSAGTILSVGSALAGGRQQRKQAEAQARMNEYQAAQMAQNAGQERASAQRSAAEERRRAQLIASRALAVAGASGGGVSDPTVANLLADLEGEGAYRSAVRLYEGESRARNMEAGAEAQRYEAGIRRRGGKAAERASYFRAGGALARGYRGLASAGSSLYDKYGAGGPADTDTFDDYPRAW